MYFYLNTQLSKRRKQKLDYSFYIFYSCSAVCWKAHKERCAFRKTDASESTTATEPLPASQTREKCTRKYNYVFPTADTVPLEKLMQIKDNGKLMD